MSHTLYEKYLSDMKRLKATPPYMTEAQVLESLGIKIEEKVIAPLQILPNKKSGVKQSLTTENRFPEVSKTIENIAPKKPKAARKPLTRKQKDKKNKARRKARAKARKQNPPKRISLEGMTADQIRKHRNALARARIKKKKENGWTYPAKTPEQRREMKEYWRKYHQDRKSDPAYIQRRQNSREKYENKLKNQNGQSL